MKQNDKIKIISNKNEKCAPSKSYSEGSCFTLEALIKIANAYNKDMVGENKEPIIIRNDKKYLLRELTTRLSSCGDDQICWLNQKFIKNLKDDDISNNTFRPEGPKGKYTWLNTNNIDQVMKQYMEHYKDFVFLGAVPIDFDDLPSLGIKNLNPQKLIDEGKLRIGVVFNLDEHYKSGSHWVALFIDLHKNEAFYFDSYGIRPDQRIIDFVKRIGRFCLTITNEFSYRYNKTRHQFKGTECGVFSLNFLLRLLKGESFDDITKNITPDDKVNLCRNVYFRG